MHSLQNVPQFEIDFWLRGHTGRLLWYDRNLKSVTQNGASPACFAILVYLQPDGTISPFAASKIDCQIQGNLLMTGHRLCCQCALNLEDPYA